MARTSAASALSLVAVLAALLSVASSSAASFARGRAYANCQQLDRKANINIAWSVDGANVHVALWAPAVNGYFAVGLSEDGWMGGGTKGFSEVWVVSSSAEPGSLCNPTCLLDGTVKSYAPPLLDTASPLSLQDVLVTRNTTTLVAEFTRALESAKPATDYTISLTAPSTVIWSSHPAKRVDSLGKMKTHLNRGSTTVAFGASRPCNWHTGGDAKEL